MAGQEGTSTKPGHPRVGPRRQGDLFDAACPTRHLLDRVGSKWTVMVVLLLAEADEVRFSVLRRGMPGVSQKMLSQTLRHLEHDGLVVRRVDAVASPPAVYYALTPLGSTLVPTLAELKRWAEEHMGEVEASSAGAAALD